jgi:2',3'-cyclic-nucleotide 2'-phosphodiesterase/3'-nucleotidase
VRPEARRIVGLSRDGRSLDPAERLVLVTNSHRANSARVETGQRRVAIATGQRVQAVLADHVRSLGTVGVSPTRSWRFLPMPGTSVVVAAGVGSERHMGDLAGYRPVSLGQDGQGFTHYRLHL